MPPLPSAPVGVPIYPGTAIPKVLITAESQPTASEFHLRGVEPEAAAIQAAFGGASHAEIQRNISVAQLSRLLVGREIWCCPGHGDAMLQAEPVLAFVGTDGRPEAVSIDTLVDTVQPHVLAGSLKLVVLTGCCTARLAAALRERAFVPHVVCWETILHDGAGRIFGTAFAQAIANGNEPVAAYKAARTAVCTGTERGHFDTGHEARVQKFELDVDPQDSVLVHPVCGHLTNQGRREPNCAACFHSGRLRLFQPGAQRGRIAAGTPKLLCYDATTLHDVPTTLPAHFQPRPEMSDLRAALVSGVRGGGTLVGIVGASPVTGIAGSAGLGKTTTALWLALDPCVRSAFRDGIFWLEFGKERTAEQKLVRLLQMLGVPHDELERLERRGIDAVRDEVARLLQGKRCLIILDDVWDKKQPWPFQRLAGGGVTVLMTTRKGHIVEAYGEQLSRLPLRPMEEVAATQLIVQSSGKAADELHAPSLQKLVKMCAGVPAMLRSVGRMCSTRSAEAVVKWFDDHRLRHRLPESMARADGYQQEAAEGNLFLAYEGQVDGLAEQDEELAMRCTMLAIFPEDTNVPLHALEELWGTDEAETREVVERLGQEHLVDVVEDGARIRLLDPVRDYLRCRGKSDLEGWHAKLLGACRVTKVGALDGEDGYWKRDEGGRRFMHHLNGCRGRLGDGSLGAMRELWLANSVGDAGAALLASALERNETLQVLLLDRNSVGDAGAASLASALERNETLQRLFLGDNSVGDAGAASLASALERNETLQELDLTSNEVGDAGAASLASALERNETLQELYLSNCSVGDAGAASLASALEQNRTLQRLTLDDNLVGDADAPSLASIEAKLAANRAAVHGE